MVVMFFATATGMVNIAKKKTPMLNGNFRPSTSEAGPKIMGPTANPKTNNAVTRIEISFEIPNSFWISAVAGLITEESKVTTETKEARRAVITTFRRTVRFLGLSYDPVNMKSASFATKA